MDRPKRRKLRLVRETLATIRIAERASGSWCGTWCTECLPP